MVLLPVGIALAVMSDVLLSLISVLTLITWSPLSVFNTKQDETALSC